MAKLYFKYGAMGSSKSAQALMTKFNYEELGMSVWLIKPSIDDRDGKDIIRSRIGLENRCDIISPNDDIVDIFVSEHKNSCDVIIADECQFFPAEQIDMLRRIVDEHGIPVLCYGLRTDFLSHLFGGSKRLFEIADSISEIKTICKCGQKAIVNARIDSDGHVATGGQTILLGGNDTYIPMCYKCWAKKSGLYK